MANCLKGVVWTGCFMAAVGWLTAYLRAPARVAYSETSARQQLFEKVFGDAVRLDTMMRDRVLADTPGKRHYVDRNSDGKPEEVWFVDTDSRHPRPYRPLLVKVIDEDGDLRVGHEPDLDSDIYIADWKADGSVDAVLDYTDLDGDNDVDEMGLYFEASFKPNALSVWWARDNGDDNLLWYDVGYTYSQTLCQYRTHFGGAEEFCLFYLTPSGSEWIPDLEDPFLFYDRDGDGVTEEVLRIDEGQGAVRNIRHSFDADNDATPENPRDFDVSLTAWAPANLRVAPQHAERIVLRGIMTGPFLKYHSALSFAAPVVWQTMMLTWDENDHNVDAQLRYSADRQERWEGVIAHGSRGFPQVGGPSCGRFNKRYELVRKPTQPARLYYHRADHRLHLYHANPAWMEVDADMDDQAEMRYDLLDTDGDGVTDTWNIDVNADGAIDDTWQCKNPQVTDVPWNWAEINAACIPVLRAVPAQLFSLVQRLEQAILSVDKNAPTDPVFNLLRSNFASPAIPPDVARKFLSSDETLRFYLDVIKDRLICDLKQRSTRAEFWNALREARARGDYDAMRVLLEQEFKLSGRIEGYAEWIAQRRALRGVPRVGWAQDRMNISWESEKIAYRITRGQFGFWGKKVSRLILKDLGKTIYSEETDWGMDALQVDNSPGCGGVTLYVNGKAYPVRNPEGKSKMVFDSRLVSSGNGRVTIEFIAKGVGPKETPYTVQFRCSALAGRPDSAVEVVIKGGHPKDRIELGVGLTKLSQEALLLDTDAGVLGAWGVQSPVAGTIGMGIVFPPQRFRRCVSLPDENQVVVRIERGVPLVYHIQCDWLRGRRFSRCPSAGDWLNDLRRTAAAVRHA